MIRNKLFNKPKGWTFSASIFLISVSPFLLISPSRETWWIRGLSDLQIAILGFLCIFFGILFLISFTISFVNFINTSRFTYNDFKSIYYLITVWIFLIILTIKQVMKIIEIPAMLHFAMIFAFFVSVIVIQEKFDEKIKD